MGYGGCNHPFQISKIKESNKTKQNIEGNPLEKEEERKSCMFVFMCTRVDTCISNHYSFKISSSTPTLKKLWMRAYKDRQIRQDCQTNCSIASHGIIF